MLRLTRLAYCRGRRGRRELRLGLFPVQRRPAQRLDCQDLLDFPRRSDWPLVELSHPESQPLALQRPESRPLARPEPRGRLLQRLGLRRDCRSLDSLRRRRLCCLHLDVGRPGYSQGSTHS